MYTEESVETFLKNQGQLFDEAVASSYEEAEEFLEDCMAVEAENAAKKYVHTLMKQVQTSVE